MSKTTNIEWATSTGNPWVGCSKVSPGCKNCYAATLDENRFSRTMGGGTPENPVSHWGKGAPRFRTKAFWKDAVKWNIFLRHCPNCGPVMYSKGQLPSYAETSPKCPDCHASTFRPRIFPSLCDIFDAEVPIQWLADYFKLVHDTPNLDHLILTKRPENFWGVETSTSYQQGRLEAVQNLVQDSEFKQWLCLWGNGQPPANVWIGVSVEDQNRADERIPALLKIPAKVRFLSIEPLLEMVNLNQAFDKYLNAREGCITSDWPILGDYIHWGIVGGESGPSRRDCGVSAIESVAKQFVESRIKCFTKQDCASKPGQRGRISDQAWALKQFPVR